MEVPRTVFVIGAGASISASGKRMPGSEGLFQKAASYGLISGGTHSELREYAQRYFGVDLTGGVINVEALLTNLEVHLTRSPLNERFLMARRQALELIEQCINHVQKEVGRCQQYERLLRRIIGRHTFVVFNWDTLLDEPLRERGSGHRHHEEYLSEIIDAVAPGVAWFKLQPANLEVFLKLHGSVDWKVCRNLQCSQQLRVVDLRYPPTPQCRSCFEPLETFIIPPVANKQLSDHPSIRKSWTMASMAIQEASEMVIWGYSLPPSDFTAHWLFRHARGGVQSAAIIDPNHRFLRDRFCDVLGITWDRVAGYEDFDEWMQGYEHE
jgi:hypothetical protein